MGMLVDVRRKVWAASITHMMTVNDFIVTWRRHILEAVSQIEKISLSWWARSLIIKKLNHEAYGVCWVSSVHATESNTFLEILQNVLGI